MSVFLPEAVPQFDQCSTAALFGFLARYRGDTLRAYSQDMQAFLQWCQARDLHPLQAQRPHLELYLRWMEQRGYAPATIGRRFRPSPASTATPSSTATWSVTRAWP